MSSEKRISFVVAVLSLALPFSGRSEQVIVKEPAYGSGRPAYFRIAFGKDGKQSMLGVIDEAKGTGKGYDVVYLDENLNGDLCDDAARKFETIKDGPEAGKLWPTFSFHGPDIGGLKARYKVYFYDLRPLASDVPGNDLYFDWGLEVGDWGHRFITGKMKYYISAAQALAGMPVRMGSECTWDIPSEIEMSLAVGVKDANGCTLRWLGCPNKKLFPRPSLTLLRDGKVIINHQKMEFG
jgi:hypothetical protein